jgi:hypothetical protein
MGLLSGIFVIKPDFGAAGECYEGIETVRDISNAIVETPSGNS